MFKVPEKNRVVRGPLASDSSYGCNGAFIIPFESNILRIIASDKEGWDHVSVSLKKRTPNWREMCLVKNIFWDEEDCVVQYHPPKGEYVDNYEYCLHLWRPQKETIPTPPTIMVGIK